MEDKIVTVGLRVAEEELSAFRTASHVDSNATAVLAMARKGLEATREGVGDCKERA